MKKYLAYLFSKRGKSSIKQVAKPVNLVEATQLTLSEYSQTFKDLARYDKREKILR